MLSREGLEHLATHLATQHVGNIGVFHSARVLRGYSANRATLKRVYLRLAEAAHQGESLTAGAEWLLDNYHLVERHAAQIKRYLPRGFYRILPKLLRGEARGLPRVYELALEFVVNTDGSADAQLSACFLAAYQSNLELSSGELWAFPIMLRLALLENLRHLVVEAERELLARREVFALVDQVLGDESRTGTEIMVELARRVSERESFLPHGALELLKRLRVRGRKAYMALQFLEEQLREKGLDPQDLLRAEDHRQATRQISVGNTLTSLNAIDQMNWREWFEGVSLADAQLRQDPAGLYLQSDFTTRDTIRHEVEKIAKRLGRTDSQIAAVAIQCARAAAEQYPGSDDQSRVQKHVGTFFMGSAREALEHTLGLIPPFRVRLKRFFLRHALTTYLGAMFIITVLLAGYVCLLAGWAETPTWGTIAALLIVLLPMSELASSLVQYLVSRWILPRPLPKLQSEGPVPSESKTLILVHTIFSSAASIQRAIDGLEVRFLGNDDPAFTFVLMADLPDYSAEHAPQDPEIIKAAVEGIETLNRRHASPSSPRFLLFFRSRKWNPQEDRWMAWERKRGKIEELNRLLRGDTSTSLQLLVGNLEQLAGVRYVITLDSDSQLSRDVGKKLVATISHPMNRPVIDNSINRVVRGYAFIQPRVTISLTSATSSPFAQLFSGQAGLDPYTNVVSEVYQDLFGEGSFWGKGIYDVEAFEHVLRGRVPENTLLSHDLFEGSFARVALASDIELYDDFPSRYMAYSKRLHRWVRGDWQLLPWLMPRVPTQDGKAPSRISWLSWWKMFDNLRRSLVPPACLLALIGGWFFLPGGPLVWTTLVLLVISFPVFTGLAAVFALPSVGISFGGFLGDIGRDLWRNAVRALLAVAFLPHQAALMLHAVSVTLYRVFISHRHLLEWEPAERAERRSKNERRDYLRLFIPAISIVIVAAVFAAWHDSVTLFSSVPLCLVWLASPWIAEKVSRPSRVAALPPAPSETRYLRSLAFDTWMFFREYLTPVYNYLMPDNLQIIPKQIVAERTSPTNISLSMLSAQTAYDLGFVPWSSALEKIARITATISSMEKYKGHLFNWYGIRDLAPLNPRYISTVDSGNLLGHLYTVLTILEEAPVAPILSSHHYEALRQLLEDLLEDPSTVELAPLRQKTRSVCDALVAHPASDSTSLVSVILSSATQELAKALSEASSSKSGATILRLSALLDDLHDDKSLLRWILPLQELAALARTAQLRLDTDSHPLQNVLSKSIDALRDANRIPPSLESIKHLRDDLLPQLQAAQAESQGSPAEGAIRALITAITQAGESSDALIQRAAETKEMIQGLIQAMDFSFLYDEARNLFTIGFNAEHARKDPSFYDLLASEARLLSFLAVARGEVPQKHWFSLGRSLANTAGGKALISWSGTMFEYLMPFIVMRDFPTTILGRTGRAVVSAQIHYGTRQSAPWGISESAYSGVDFEKTYQYRAFGVPGLGLKRGLSEDLVVSPYSTLLALSFAPTIGTAVDNLRFLEREGARGQFGFYEAIDYTTSRHTRAEGKHIVQSFFAHHQGMSLISINNALNNQIMCERFHAQPIVKSAELLLHERFPERVATIIPHEPELSTIHREEAEVEAPGLEVVSTPHSLAPRVRLLSNGRYSVVVDSAGGGCSSYDRTLLLSRWREDPTTSPYGSFIYIHDSRQKITWSAAYQPTKAVPDSYEAIFSPGRAEFKRFDDKIFAHTEITVAPEDDVELRRVTITNLSDRERELDIASYIEPVLCERRADSAHPAFSKLFVRAEPLPDYDAIICQRRPRTDHEQELFFFHRVTLRTSYAPVRFYTSRSSFIGRSGSLERPAIFEGPGSAVQPLDGNVDPITSLGCTVRLEPGASETLVFVSGATRSRHEAQTLIERYQELLHVTRAFELSWSRAQVELRSHAYSAIQADLFHRLAGCLLYNEENVRALPQVIQDNRLGQASLWRFGISGDMPIMLLKMSDSRQTRILQEVLLGHHFLRERGLEFDLVVLHKNQGTYMQHLAEDIEYAVRLSPAGALLDKRGGIFLRSSSQISEAESTLLETVARVVLDCDVGGLSELLSKAAFDQVAPPTIPKPAARFQRALKDAPLLVERNQYGGFAPDTNHYHLPAVGASRPPLPWSNVIANPHFGFLVTESGGGYTWSENSRENRITAWSNDPILDSPSEAIFLRKAETGEYWSLTPKPAGVGLEYSVEHGFGQSSFSTNNAGVETQLTLSGSNHERVKWFSITLSNLEPQEQKIELYLYCDLVLGITRDDSYRYLTTGFDRTSQTLHAQNFYNNEFAGRVVALGASEPVVSYTTSRVEFLGKNGSLSSPQALERGAHGSFLSGKGRGVKLSARVGAGYDQCAALQVHVSLKPREERQVVFFLSEHSSLETMRREAPKFRSPQMQLVELQGVTNFLHNLLSTIEIQSPSPSWNILMNGWLLYQTIACRLFGRSAFYQSGGALGFRDQLQDSLALLPIRPDMVRSQILLHAAHQFKEGDVQHWWHPPTGRGVRTRISDDLLWLPYAVSRYIETTGDYSILSERIPYLQGAPLAEGQMETYFIPERSSEEGTILEHCLRTFNATSAVGPHGLPLIGAGDWNDGMNEIGRHGKGESVWLAWFQNEVIRRFVPILEAQGELETATTLKAHAQALATAAEHEAWDGAWYRRAYYDDGTPVGSAQNDECKIDSLCQSWAIISKAGDPERAETAMQSAIDLLVDQEGRLIKLLTPAFNKTEKNPGYIKGYPPGVRENGGQYTHAAAWLIIARALQGRGSEAFSLFELINPINATRSERGVQTYQAEPYVMCGDVYSEYPLRGRAGWSWYTGSAGWLYQAGVEFILGLRCAPLSLTVDPCIPSDWDRLTAVYRHQSRTFAIEILNPNGSERGVSSLEVNGVVKTDLTIPYEDPSYGDTVAIKVVLR
jgi:cellobiose phosphorylase